MKLNLGRLQVQWGGGKAKAGFADVQAARTFGANLGLGAEWTPETYAHYYATSVPAYRAIKLRADAVASAPLVVYQRRPGAKPVPVPETHPVQELLDAVNPWWTASDLWKATETYLSIWGSAYWWLERQGGRVVTIWPMRPDHMRIIPGAARSKDYILGYEYEGNKRVPFAPNEIIWFRYFNPMDEYAGLAPVAPGRLSLDLGRDALRFHRNRFRQGAVFQEMLFTVQGPVTDQQIEEFYERLAKRQRDDSNNLRPLVWDMSQGGKPERMGLSPADMAVLEAMNYSVEDAARTWGVPPPKLYSQQSSIYNNVKQADVEFYTDTISTEWAFLSTEVNELLIPLIAPGEDLFVAFDTSKVMPLQDALADLRKADLEEVKFWTMTVNEYREKYGREPVEWGDEPLPRAPSFGAQTPGESGQAAFPARQGGNVAIEKALTGFEQRLRFADAKFLTLQRSLFEEQQRDVVAQLRLRKGFFEVKESPVDDSIFNQTEWVARYKRRGLPLLTEVLTLSAQGQAVEFALGAFDPSLLSVRSWLEARTAFWADRVNLETAQLLMAELADARAQGESIAQIQMRVEKVFRFNDMVRSERIARTETLAAANQGHLAVYEQSGVVEEKMWLATLDERVRAAHAQAHRQVVPLHGQFFVGGEMLSAPGLGSDPSNNIQCRCTTLPILRRRSFTANGATHGDLGGQVVQQAEAI